MAGSNSSISSNENEGTTKPIAAGRGYNLEAPSNAPAPMPMVAPTDGGQSSRSQTPPPPNVLQSDTNPPTTNSPAAASKNALGITHGWGVGLAHSGSYLGKPLVPCHFMITFHICLTHSFPLDSN